MKKVTKVKIVTSLNGWIERFAYDAKTTGAAAIPRFNNVTLLTLLTLVMR
jgi:hypothetical protein